MQYGHEEQIQYLLTFHGVEEGHDVQAPLWGSSIPCVFLGFFISNSTRDVQWLSRVAVDISGRNMGATTELPKNFGVVPCVGSPQMLSKYNIAI